MCPGASPGGHNASCDDSKHAGTVELFGDEGGDDRAQDSEKGIVVDADVARHQPLRRAAPSESPSAIPTPAMMPAVMMTRMVADRMTPRNTRFMRTSETDNDSQYSRKGRKIVRTIVGDN